MDFSASVCASPDLLCIYRDNTYLANSACCASQASSDNSYIDFVQFLHSIYPDGTTDVVDSPCSDGGVPSSSTLTSLTAGSFTTAGSSQAVQGNTTNYSYCVCQWRRQHQPERYHDRGWRAWRARRVTL